MTSAAFRTIMDIVRAQAMVEERLAGELAAVHGLALSEAILLMHLQRAPLARLTRVELARRLRVNPSTVTRMALPLEKNGLLGREPDPRDARLAYVTLTPIGMILIAEVRATLERRCAEFFRDRWTPEEIETLSALTARLTAGEVGDII